MELKSCITSFFLLFLLLDLPCISRGVNGSEKADSDVIYEIDYRGPETHSSAMPPPGHSHSHGRPFINRQNAMSSRKSKPSSSGNDKKIQG